MLCFKPANIGQKNNLKLENAQKTIPKLDSHGDFLYSARANTRERMSEITYALFRVQG